jgi:hypothetical protein
MKLSSFVYAFRGASQVAMGGLLALTIASCGGGGGSAGSVPGVPPVDPTVVVGSVALIFSTPSLPSSGAAGTEVTVTALVKTAANTAISNAVVAFGADSGALSSIQATTDTNGKATALLSTSGDHSNRQITVTASSGGKSTTGTVSVVGAGITVVGASTIAASGTADFTATVTDSGTLPIPIASVPVTISSQAGNSFVVKTSSGGTATAPLTNSLGQVTITVTATHSGADVLTFTSQGATVTKNITVNSSLLTVTIAGLSGVTADANTVTTGNTGTSCQAVNAHYTVNGAPQSGSVNLSTSRGQLFTDSGCGTVLSLSTVAIGASGDSTPVYLKSNTAGDATVTGVIGGLSAQATSHFVALLSATATISLQADPAVIAPNTGASTVIEKSILTAVVRDGTAFNNVVENAQVEFSILADASGGSLSSPQVGTTGADGAAKVSFIAGSATTPTSGVQIRATIQGTATSKTATLTVAKKSLFIAAGTGNLLGSPNDTQYSQNYSVFVTDASGNPVPGVTITATATPTRYFKGTYIFTTFWVPNIVASCANEDLNLNGILDLGEDGPASAPSGGFPAGTNINASGNNNGVLDPGIPLNITSSGTTDATGTAVITILYPKDRANWTEVTLAIRGSVAGTESIYTVPPYTLPVLAADASSSTTPPPGFVSPYGVNTPCTAKN